MRIQEAIQEIELFLELGQKQLPHCGSIIGALEIAIEAMKKQVPKKPIVDIKDRDFVQCPSCSGSVYTGNVIEAIHNRETTYCEHCGQKLDWSDKNG